MQVGDLVRYSLTENVLGVITAINRVDPNRPFYFVRWIDPVHNDTWYHPLRLEAICK